MPKPTKRSALYTLIGVILAALVAHYTGYRIPASLIGDAVQEAVSDDPEHDVAPLPKEATDGTR